LQHKDGHSIWAQAAVSVMRDEEGLPNQLIAQIESLEARRRTENKLAEERERLRIALHSIDAAVITTDAQSQITYINAAAESLFELNMNAIEGRRVDEVVTDIVSPVLESTGVVSGLVIVFHDVTREVDRTRDLRHRAMHDPLTGLGNRAEFEEQLLPAPTHFVQIKRLGQHAVTRRLRALPGFLALFQRRRLQAFGERLEFLQGVLEQRARGSADADIARLEGL
jgi:GGDEF domain-containing protein